MPGELADHLIDSQAVVLTHMVQEPQSMVLETGDHSRAQVCEAQVYWLCGPGQVISFFWASAFSFLRWASQ